MIHWLKGKVQTLLPGGVVLNVGGVGYGLELPLSALIQVTEDGTEKEFWIFTHVREDSLRLFGFNTQTDRQMFALLLGISGVGPKVALAIMSTLTIDDIIGAAHYDQTAQLERVPGIGKRTAERVLVELKPKIERFEEANRLEAGPGSASSAGATSGISSGRQKSLQIYQDAHSGLLNLGFKTKDIDKALHKITEKDQEIEFQELMRLALMALTGREIAAPVAKKAGLESSLF